MQNLMMKWTTVGSVILLAGCATPPTASRVSRSVWSLEATPVNPAAAELSNDTAEHLAWVEAYRDRVVEVQGPRTIENTLIPCNDMLMHLDAAGAQCSLFANVHPDDDVRLTAEEGEQDVARVATELGLDRDLYEAIKAVDVSRADEATRYMVRKMLRDFRRSGVDKTDAERAEIERLNREIVQLGQEFARIIREDVREITLDSVSDLEGMPEDWIAQHAPGADGKIHINTQYPDYIPFITYARHPEARLVLYREFKDRGFPENIEVLQQLLVKRYELANILGYENYAQYITEDKMIGSAQKAEEFINKIAEVGRAAAERDYRILLDRKRKDDPGASDVGDWEKAYYEQLVKAEDYAFDSQEVRPYFNFEGVREGLFTLTSLMFGIEYRPATGVDLWNDDVTAWDVYEEGQHLGRFYLDLHPRPNKYQHAACFDFRSGIEGKRLPQAVLVCNFPSPRASQNGVALMEHDQVLTFFHEFGHLLHNIFAGHRKWIGNTGISTEWDFVEAPSQMFEEWCWDVETLQLFALHHETGEPIPADLVRRMKRAADFGKGLANNHQAFYAAVSLNYYNRDPQGVDTTELMMELQERYSSFKYVDDTHFQCNFGHLDGYSAIYYTYKWSEVIAKDMFSRFKKEGLLNPEATRAYRRFVLDPGGSKPAAELVEAFLGRPYSFDAFREWLNNN